MCRKSDADPVSMSPKETGYLLKAIDMHAGFPASEAFLRSFVDSECSEVVSALVPPFINALVLREIAVQSVFTQLEVTFL